MSVNYTAIQYYNYAPCLGFPLFVTIYRIHPLIVVSIISVIPND